MNTDPLNGQPWRIDVGDALETLRGLPDGVFQCAVTSPPYYALRDYGSGRWEGGDTTCDHKLPGRTQNLDKLGARLGTGGGHKQSTDEASSHQPRDVCPRCGAVRTDKQQGLEKSPYCFGWTTGNPCGAEKVTLRDDLTDEEVLYVYAELKRLGLL